MTPELFFSCIYRQKTYRSECPATHRAIAKVQFEIFYIHVIFEHVFINKKLPFQVVYLTGTQNRNIIYFLFFSSTVMKKTYESECPISVDSHSKVPVEPTDQIFTVSSQLLLASLPSLLHATDITL